MELGSNRKAEARTQFAALCYQSSKKSLKLLLITSRRMRRWVLPKGWPVDGMTPAQTAMLEAFEEAGVSGTIEEKCIGHYSYRKYLKRNSSVPCIVAVFPVKVKGLKKRFPEIGQRHRKWFSREKAAAAVSENELKDIILNFDPKHIEGERK